MSLCFRIGQSINIKSRSILKIETMGREKANTKARISIFILLSVLVMLTTSSQLNISGEDDKVQTNNNQNNTTKLNTNPLQDEELQDKSNLILRQNSTLNQQSAQNTNTDSNPNLQIQDQTPLSNTFTKISTNKSGQQTNKSEQSTNKSEQSQSTAKTVDHNQQPSNPKIQQGTQIIKSQIQQRTQIMKSKQTQAAKDFIEDKPTLSEQKEGDSVSQKDTSSQKNNNQIGKPLDHKLQQRMGHIQKSFKQQQEQMGKIQKSLTSLRQQQEQMSNTMKSYENELKLVKEQKLKVSNLQLKMDEMEQKLGQAQVKLEELKENNNKQSVSGKQDIDKAADKTKQELLAKKEKQLTERLEKIQIQLKRLEKIQIQLKRLDKLQTDLKRLDELESQMQQTFTNYHAKLNRLDEYPTLEEIHHLSQKVDALQLQLNKQSQKTSTIQFNHNKQQHKQQGLQSKASLNHLQKQASTDQTQQLNQQKQASIDKPQQLNQQKQQQKTNNKKQQPQKQQQSQLSGKQQLQKNQQDNDDEIITTAPNTQDKTKSTTTEPINQNKQHDQFIFGLTLSETLFYTACILSLALIIRKFITSNNKTNRNNSLSSRTTNLTVQQQSPPSTNRFTNQESTHKMTINKLRQTQYDPKDQLHIEDSIVSQRRISKQQLYVSEEENNQTDSYNRNRNLNRNNIVNQSNSYNRNENVNNIIRLPSKQQQSTSNHLSKITTLNSESSQQPQQHYSPSSAPSPVVRGIRPLKKPTNKSSLQRFQATTVPDAFNYYQSQNPHPLTANNSFENGSFFANNSDRNKEQMLGSNYNNHVVVNTANPAQIKSGIVENGITPQQDEDEFQQYSQGHHNNSNLHVGSTIDGVSIADKTEHSTILTANHEPIMQHFVNPEPVNNHNHIETAPMKDENNNLEDDQQEQFEEFQQSNTNSHRRNEQLGEKAEFKPLQQASEEQKDYQGAEDQSENKYHTKITLNSQNKHNDPFSTLI